MILFKTHAEGGCQPVLVCEACRQPITDARQAVVFVPAEPPLDAAAPALHAHTGSCFNSTLLMQESDEDWVAQDLDVHLGRLVTQAGLALDGDDVPDLSGKELEDALRW